MEDGVAVTGIYRAMLGFAHWAPLLHGGTKGDPYAAGWPGQQVVLIDDMEDWLRRCGIAYTLERDPSDHWIVYIEFRSEPDLVQWKMAWL